MSLIAPTERGRELLERLQAFFDRHIFPNEVLHEQQMHALRAAGNPWQPVPLVEALKPLAREAGLSVRAKRLTRDEVYCADEVFFTGTAAEITPVVEVDARRIANGQPGPITRRLQQAYFAAVRGEDERHDDWLTPAT